MPFLCVLEKERRQSGRSPENKDKRVLDAIRDRKGFPCSSVVKNPPANAGDLGSIPDTRGSHVHQNLTKPVSHNY